MVWFTPEMKWFYCFCNIIVVMVVLCKLCKGNLVIHQTLSEWTWYNNLKPRSRRTTTIFKSYGNFFESSVCFNSSKTFLAIEWSFSQSCKFRLFTERGWPASLISWKCYNYQWIQFEMIDSDCKGQIFFRIVAPCLLVTIIS